MPTIYNLQGFFQQNKAWRPKIGGSPDDTRTDRVVAADMSLSRYLEANRHHLARPSPAGDRAADAKTPAVVSNEDTGPICNPTTNLEKIITDSS